MKGFMKKYQLVSVAMWGIGLAAAFSASAQSAYFSAVTNLNPAGYWPMHEVAPPAPGDIETNYGTLGLLGTGYYPDWADANKNIILRQGPGALAGDSDAAVQFTQGKVTGTTVSFTNGLFVPHTSPLSTLIPPFSVECWFYPTNTTTGVAIWGQTDYTGLNSGVAGAQVNYNGIILNWANGTFVPYGFNKMNGGVANSNKLNGNGSPTEPANQWYHLVVVCDANTNFTLYVNGSPVAGPTKDAGKYAPDYWSPLTIGCGLGGLRSIAGSLDEFAVYTNALTLGDVQNHYNAANDPATYGTYYANVVAGNPVIYLRMDSLPYTAPDPSTWPVLMNYGMTNGVAVGNGVYSPGTMPGLVAGPFNLSGVPLGGLSGPNVAQLSGISSFADAGYAAAYDPTGAVPFSVAAMFRGNPSDNRFQTIIGHSDNSWRITMNTNGTLLCQLGTNTTSLANSAGVYNDGKWHQVVAVYTPNPVATSPGINALYVDGVLDGSSSNVDPNGVGPGSALDVLIGGDPQYTNSPAGAGRQFAGQVCEVAFFTNALTLSQVQTLYNASGVVPYLTSQPATGRTANGGPGTSIAFAVTGGGSMPLAYQWYFNTSSNYDGAAQLIDNAAHYRNSTTPQLTVTNLTGNDSGYYYVVLTNNSGSVTSILASLTAYSAPTFSQDLAFTNLTVFAGGQAAFSIAAAGASPLRYQWYLNNTAIALATNASYSLTNAQPPNTAPAYYCVVTNIAGSATSSVAIVNILPDPTTAYPSNILAANPIGYWRLNEPDDGRNDNNNGVVANDYWGGNVGFYTNVALGQPGYNSLSRDPNGTSAGFGSLSSQDSDVFGIPMNVDFSAPASSNSPFSIEAWTQGSWQTTDAGIVSKGYAGAEQFSLDCGSDALTAANPVAHSFRFLVRAASGTAVSVNSSVNPGDGLWHHLAGVCDELNGFVYLYVDGVPVGTNAISPGSGILSSARGMLIGSKPSNANTNNDLQLSGLIEDVAVYNYALSPAQVLTHFSAGDQPAAVLVQPANTIASLFGTATFYAGVRGSLPLSYQWYDQNNALINGATNATLVLNNVSSGMDGNMYHLAVSNAFGTDQSQPASLQVISGAPVVYGNPASQYLVPASGTISIPVTAYGTMPLYYQWQKGNAFTATWTNLVDDGRITGSQSNVLTIADAKLSDAAHYQVIITNASGSTPSSFANLVVLSLPIGFNGTGLGWSSVGSARMAGDNLLSLTDPNNGGGNGNFFYQYPQYVGAFQASFTYQAGGNLAADGATFCIQNDPRGPSARGSNGGQLGVGPANQITPSLELELNLSSGGGSTRGYTVLTNGLTGTGGANGGYHPIGNVNLNSGDPIDITVLYANGQMALTFTDAVAGTSFQTNLFVGDLPTIVGGSTAYFGFTGAYGGLTSVQTISNFSFVSLPALAIRLSGVNAPISWSGLIEGYVLQQNSDLSTTHWVTVTNQDNLVDGLHQVIVPANSSNLFYRLILQP